MGRRLILGKKRKMAGGGEWGMRWSQYTNYISLAIRPSLIWEREIERRKYDRERERKGGESDFEVEMVVERVRE